MGLESILILVVLAAGFYLSFNIGANDVANTMGTSVGSRALTIKKAIIIAAICEFLGALLIGDEVSKTIKQGFVSPDIFANDPIGFAYGMTAAILATSFWLQFCTFRGLPVSTTHSIVGAVLGFAIVQGGGPEINYAQLLAIFSSWIFSPVIGALVSYGSLLFILRFIIDTHNPYERAQKLIPVIIGVTVSMLCVAFTIKIANKITHGSGMILGILAAMFFGAMAAFYFYRFIPTKTEETNSRATVLRNIEKIFGRMQLVTACFLAFAHGSNDVANAIGPAAAVVSALHSKTVGNESEVPFWLLFLGGLGIVVGLMLMGRKVIETVGNQITKITPTRGFAAEFAAALTILIGTILGMPLSTTHVLVGAVIGVGLARGIGGIDASVIKRIGRSWIITMPATACLSIAFSLALRLF